LLEDSPEARESRDKIVQLLLSGDTSNLRLAFELLQGGGVHVEMWSYIVGVSILDVSNAFASKIQKLMQTFGEARLYKAVRYRKCHSLADAKSFLSDRKHNLFKQFPFLEKRLIAYTMLLLKRFGLTYCLRLKPAILPAESLLRFFLHEGVLDLSHQGLSRLPKEIGKLTEATTLDISHNRIVEIPDEVGEMKQLNRIYTFDTPLSEAATRKLDSFFPHIFADKRHLQAIHAFSAKRYTNALEAIERAVALSPNEPNYWVTYGSIVARASGDYKTAIAYTLRGTNLENASAHPETVMLAWANISGFRHKVGEEEGALAAAEQGLALYDQYPKAETNWKGMLYFRKGQALFHLDRLDEALLAYDMGAQLAPKNSEIFYNMACIYVRWRRKEEALAYLKRAISIRAEHGFEAMCDKDFEPYWTDGEFLAIAQTAS
jgi:tetratricopeptide (TPR) repeat protein